VAGTITLVTYRVRASYPFEPTVHYGGTKPMTATTASTSVTKKWFGPDGLLNTKYHKPALMVFLFVVLAHWAEHIAQAIQIYALGWARPKAGGLLGLAYPWLIRSEWLHYGFAVVMLVAFVVLRHGFVGRARTWWMTALWVQTWHHFEHLLLLVQAMTGTNMLGKPVPTSVAQLVFPRVELHLFYNSVVFIPMVVAMVRHLRPNATERKQMHCGCVRVALANPS
jgi:hypothetical protein